MRTLDRFDSSAGERGKRLLRSAETAVHQLVLAEHHGEIGAPSHQAKLNVCAGHACRIDLQPRNHAMLLRCFGWIARPQPFEPYPPGATDMSQTHKDK